jgi:DegV family protein with EDD domain
LQKVTIIADSIACLTPDTINRYQLKIIPIKIHFNGHIYRDGIDITPAEAYRLLEEAPHHFATSPSSVGDYIQAYRDASDQAKNILCITISAKLSTTFNTACIAREQTISELGQTAIEVMDSKTAAVGEGLIITAVAKAATEGKDLSEVTDLAKAVREKINVIGIMESVEYVYRTGRVPKITARLGSMFDIKPVFSIREGLIHLAGISRSKKQAIKKALMMIKNKVGIKPVHVAIAHAGVPEEGEQLKENIASTFNCVELWLTDFSPVMGYSTGTGVLAIAFYTDEDTEGIPD